MLVEEGERRTEERRMKEGYGPQEGTVCWFHEQVEQGVPGPQHGRG